MAIDEQLVHRHLQTHLPGSADRVETQLPEAGSSSLLFRLGDELLIEMAGHDLAPRRFAAPFPAQDRNLSSGYRGGRVGGGTRELLDAAGPAALRSALAGY
ncbi:hypothetical protein [Pimelobacter simplex]|uniref:hypothetical protein n=1 Tax=Nocardioides simplex TaxID=2045 RepID=UPI001932C9CA|nr:hypothetical protein [Pimelobacter simplex]